MIQEAALLNYSNNVQKGDKYWYQYTITLIVTLFHFSTGFSLGWNSPAIPKLFQSNTPITVTVDDTFWIIAITEVGFVLSTIPAPWMMDKYGRKIALMFGILPIMVAWIIIGTTTHVSMLYVARVLCGITGGFGFIVAPMYIGEIASAKVRGTLTLLLTVSTKIGVLVAYSIGPFVSFRMQAFISLLPPLLFFVLSFLIPESPYFLLAKDKRMEALKCLCKLRRHLTVTSELDMMEETLKKSKENNGTIRELIYVKGSRRAVLIITGLLAAHMMCGSQVVIANAQTIFEKFGSTFASSHMSMIFSVVQVILVILSACTVDWVGRKPLLLVSTSGMAICHCIVGVYFLLVRYSFEGVHSYSLIPSIAVIVFIGFYVMGLGCISVTILSEIFPPNLKAVAGAFYSIVGACLAIAVYKYHHVVSIYFGYDVSFFSYSMFCVIFIPFMLYVVPETKGRSLDIILKKLNREKGTGVMNGENLKCLSVPV